MRHATTAGLVLVLAVLAASAGNATADHGTLSPGELLARIAVGPELGTAPGCPKYNRKRQYKYSSRKLRERLLREQGRVTAYDRRRLSTGATGRDVHVEHIVAAKEAHESGACRWRPGERRAFASDVLNLTLALPRGEPAQVRQGPGRWLDAEVQSVLVRGDGGEGESALGVVDGPAGA